MMKPQEQKQDLTALMWIHSFLSFAVIGVLLFFFGCKEIQEEKASLGSAVEKQSVDNALVDAQGNASPFKMQKGEASLYFYTYEIEGSPPTFYGQTSLQVLGFDEETANGKTYLKVYLVGEQFDPETGDKMEGSFSVLFDPDDWRVGSDSMSLFQTRSTEAAPILSPSSLNPLNDGRSVIRETYHGLKVKLLRMSPPLVVSEKEDCGGVPNCEMRVTRIVYDKAFWTSDSDFIKVTFEYDISMDPPFMGLIVRECTSVQEPVENRKYFIRRCRTLQDFLYGAQPE